jgi:hypothetical protein
MRTVVDTVPSQDWEFVAAPAGTLAPDSPIRERVKQVLAASRPTYKLRERRREVRHPFPYALIVTPLDAAGQPMPHAAANAIGKHLSESGLDFYCLDPLPYRRVIITFDLGGEDRGSLLMDLGWTRFGRHGWYENGGRFRAVVPSPASS